MNVNLLIANTIMGQLEQETTIDRNILLDNGDFMNLFKVMLNNNQDMETIKETLTGFINDNY